MTSLTLHRPITLARRGMVVAPHYLAAEAGHRTAESRRQRH